MQIGARSKEAQGRIKYLITTLLHPFMQSVQAENRQVLCVLQGYGSPDDYTAH